MTIYAKRRVRIVSFIFVMILCFSLLAPIALAEEGSLYIDFYVAGMTAGSNGKVTVSYHITGTGTMDQIGAISITIYENGTAVKTYSSSTTVGMMSSNTFIHASTITYSGTVGKSYSAYVTFQAGKNGGWYNRGMDTNSVTAIN